MTSPLTEQKLDTAREHEIRTLDLTPLMNDLSAARVSGYLATLLSEVDRLRAELDAAPRKALAAAADVVDAKLTAEPDHNRASALYELLLQLRGELPCTCARTGGLHAKDCSKYVPGHELISRHNALAVYRAATAPPAV